jgi:pimeloyl-ACP methyl ester carboxylesterase
MDPELPDRTIIVDGIQVHIEGGGPESIVMVHGWPDTYRLWDRQVQALQSHYRCIRFSLPGFEQRQSRRTHSLDQLVELLRRIGEKACRAQPMTLLLHDWGCVFGYQFALRYPQLVRRIIGVDVGDAGSRPHMQSLAVWAKAFIFGYQVWLALAWRIGGRLGDAMARAMALLLRCPSDPAFIGAHMGYPYYLLWTGALRGAKVFRPACPMLFIYGQRKPLMFHSPDWAEDLASRPGSAVLAFDCGHWVMVSKQVEFDRAVTAWLATGDAAQ